VRDIVNAGVRLLAISLIAALLLAGTNMITRGPIAEHERENAIAARQAVAPDADSFDPVVWPGLIELTAFPSLIEAFEAKRDGEVIGYTFLFAPMGYKAEIPVSVGIMLPDEPGGAGIVSGVAIGNISETSGLGTRVKEDAFLRQFEGARADRLDDGVNTISGATISSGAVKGAVRNAALAFDALRMNAGQEGL
jgi:electron transport complex protein RnfG